MGLSIYEHGALTKPRLPSCAGVFRRLRKIGNDQKWTSTMTYKRGDIVLAVFPDSNLRTSKRRPTLVVQADNLGTGISQIILAMITSNLTRAGHPSRATVSIT